MKRAIVTLALFLAFAEFTKAQTNGGSSSTEMLAAIPEPDPGSYTVFGATSLQEAALRAQIRLMHPEILPLRVFFVPHWKYVDNARIFRLHVPTGYASLMFTHLPSRTVFIDNDRYQGEKWLGYWIAHELGHLVTNSAKEEDAERAAREFRRRLRESQNQAPAFRNWVFRMYRRQLLPYRIREGLLVICPQSARYAVVSVNAG